MMPEAARVRSVSFRARAPHSLHLSEGDDPGLDGYWAIVPAYRETNPPGGATLPEQKPPYLTPGSGDTFPATNDLSRTTIVRETIIHGAEQRTLQNMERSFADTGQNGRPAEKSVSDHPPPETTHAARVLIGWFAGGLAFQCIETMHDGYWPALGYGLGAVVVAYFDYKLPRVLARSPQLTKSLNQVAANAWLWVGVGIASLLIIAASPYVEQRRWPFAWQFVSPPAPAPTEPLFTQQVNEKIVAATAAIQKQLDQVTTERDAANRRIRELEALQHAPPTPPTAAEGPRVFTDKTSKEQVWNTYCEGRTELQCSILMNEEKNKWITLGAVVAIVHAGGGVEFNNGIICQFGSQWLPALSTLRTGDHVTITGQIVGFNVRFFILQKCEIKTPS